MAIKLTDEQACAVALAKSGDDLKVEAFAGAGKTSTLVAIGEALGGKRGLYLAFNKAIATEAATKFPASVECRTAHSLAYAAVGYKYRDRFQRLSGTILATQYLGLPAFVCGVSGPAFGGLVLDTISHYCYSADAEITRDHAPWGTLKKIEDSAVRYAVAEEAVRQARLAWPMMIDPKGTCPITHDVYLKLWSLSKPKFSRDFLLFDEAQDANAVMLDLALGQDSQKILVGDRYQQIYSWRGAINAMQSIDMPSCLISQSFRFGQSVADVANGILNDALGAGVNIRGFESVASKVEPLKAPKAILCRTNARLITSLLARLNRGEKATVAGGCGDTISLLRAAKELMAGKKTLHRELALFNDWQEVVDYSETDTGSDMAGLVTLIRSHDPDKLIKQLEVANRTPEDQASTIFSTAHKAKGREWDTVKLEGDFRHPESKAYTSEETNLLYVAATRGKLVLDMTDVDREKRSLAAKAKEEAL